MEVKGVRITGGVGERRGRLNVSDSISEQKH